MKSKNILFLMMAVASAPEPVLMSSVPITRDSWTPRKTVHSSYGAIDTVEDQEMMITAHLSMNTTLPTIQLDNFIEIVRIDCSDSNVMELVFDYPENAESAYQEWVAYEKFAVFVGHEHGCNHNDAATFHVTSIELFSVQSLRLDTIPKGRHDVVSDWTLDFNRTPVKRLSKRDFQVNYSI